MSAFLFKSSNQLKTDPLGTLRILCCSMRTNPDFPLIETITGMGMPYAGSDALQLTEKTHDPNRITSHIGFRGSLTNGGFVGKNPFNPRDWGFMFDSFAFCQRMKFGIDRDFSFTALDNLDDPEADFLDPELKWPTQCLMVGFISNSKDKAKINIKNDWCISPYHFEHGSYWRAAERNGAWLIMTIGARETEISADKFAGEDHPKSPYIEVTRPLMERALLLNSYVTVAIHRDYVAKLTL